MGCSSASGSNATLGAFFNLDKAKPSASKAGTSKGPGKRPADGDSESAAHTAKKTRVSEGTKRNTRASAGAAQAQGDSVVNASSDSESNDVEIIDVPKAGGKKKKKGKGVKKAAEGKKTAKGCGQVQVEETPEEQLERLKKRWLSPIYGLYEAEPHAEIIEGRICHIFACLRCGHDIQRFPTSKDAGSTSNLIKHARKCWHDDVVDKIMTIKNLKESRRAAKEYMENGHISSFFEVKAVTSYRHTTLTRWETRAWVVRWVCENLRPFQIVSDHAFKVLMITGRPGYKLPSPKTVSRDVKLLHKHTYERLAAWLKEYDGRLNFGTDAWTSPNHRAFMAVTVHFEFDGRPVNMLLDLVEVAESHTGENLSEAFIQILENFGIEEKILAVTCDNASNNDAMVNRMDEELIYFMGNSYRVRCFAHIINLCAKSLTRLFDVREKSDSKDKKLKELAVGLETEELLATIERYKGGVGMKVGDDNNAGWVDELQKLSEDDLETFEQDVRPVKMVIAKLRKLSFKIVNSTTKLLPVWRNIAQELRVSDKLIPRDVRTRWNSMFDMLKGALDSRRLVTRICGDPDLDLDVYQLKQQEWEIVEQLCEILASLKDATLFFSRQDTTLALVLPIMERVRKMFAEESEKAQEYNSAVCVALRMAKRTLDKYYHITDDSNTYRIAMVLHPTFKLRYFSTHLSYTRGYIENVRKLVRDEFDRNYSHLPIEDEPCADEQGGDSGDKGDHVNMYDDITSLALKGKGPQRRSDELDRYLKADQEEVGDVLQWWQKNRYLYPRLYRMALDFLRIPPTSVDVERVFSRGRLVLSHVRSRLGADTTRALLCLGEWSKLGLVKDQDLKDVGNMPDAEDADSAVTDHGTAENDDPGATLVELLDDDEMDYV